MNKISTLSIGASGIIASSAAPSLLMDVTQDVSSVAQVLVQLVIGIVTLIGLLKKKRNN